MTPEKRPLRVAILGVGTVGAEVARGFLRSPDRQIGPAGGRMLELVAIADMNVQGAVDRGMPRELIVPDAAAVIRRDDVDVIVELLGGDEPARSLIAEALKAGKPVVTANKHVLAHHGVELEKIARASGAALRYEASVCGGTPVLDPIARDLAANHIRRVRGIVNGSTNFILTEMMQAKRSYEEVLAAAQAQGYVERDPRADVEGHDAANKLAVLTRLAFGAWPRIDSIVACPPSVRGDGKLGITGVSANDIAGAVALGLAIRLVATASTPGTAEPGFGLAGSVMTCAVPTPIRSGVCLSKAPAPAARPPAAPFSPIFWKWPGPDSARGRTCRPPPPSSSSWPTTAPRSAVPGTSASPACSRRRFRGVSPRKWPARRRVPCRGIGAGPGSPSRPGRCRSPKFARRSSRCSPPTATCPFIRS
jgi:homoserine dehydrogenase